MSVNSAAEENHSSFKFQAQVYYYYKTQVNYYRSKNYLTSISQENNLSRHTEELNNIGKMFTLNNCLSLTLSVR